MLLPAPSNEETGAIVYEELADDWIIEIDSNVVGIVPSVVETIALVSGAVVGAIGVVSATGVDSAFGATGVDSAFGATGETGVVSAIGATEELSVTGTDSEAGADDSGAIGVVSTDGVDDSVAVVVSVNGQKVV